jgi:hypothetical protein
LSGFLLHCIHEALGKFSGFIFQFVHDDVPHNHHYGVGLNPLGRVIHQVVTSLWKPDDHGKLRTIAAEENQDNPTCAILNRRAAPPNKNGSSLSRGATSLRLQP